MIEKEKCLPGLKVVVNNKISKWNKELGSKNNGLFAFIFRKGGHSLGDTEYEIPEGTKIEILSKPKTIPDSGVQVQFKMEGNDTIYASWWVVFKHKVDEI